jgi:hypothetical protein
LILPPSTPAFRQIKNPAKKRGSKLTTSDITIYSKDFISPPDGEVLKPDGIHPFLYWFEELRKVMKAGTLRSFAVSRLGFTPLVPIPATP